MNISVMLKKITLTVVAKKLLSYRNFSYVQYVENYFIILDSVMKDEEYNFGF